MKMNEQFTLSRYLYCIDEVALNIVDSLLEKNNPDVYNYFDEIASLEYTDSSFVDSSNKEIPRFLCLICPGSLL